ncbi:MAG: DNA polymerase I [Chitinispirillales bacterium]|nr:DNA polymerase I [Chitinispirillales bacterium]
MNEKKLYLIDGYAFAYRAHYALIRSPLVNSKGFPTSALYGFANYLLRLIEAYKCSYMAVVMDSSVPTFRHEAYAEYKANRAKMPDELRAQIPRIYEMLDAFNIPVVKRDGFEADDIIASLTRKAVSENFEVFLVTKDKDLMQLVGPKVRMLVPESAGVFHIIEQDGVIDKMGVRPDQILDYLSIVGDASDNIPGVHGVGPKGAAKILETTTVDQILENPDILESPKLIEKFKEYKDRLALSKMLATLRFDVDLNLEVDDLKRKNIDLPRSQSLLKEFEFFSMLKNPIFGLQTKFEPALQIIDSVEKIRELVDKIKAKGQFSIDISASTQSPREAFTTGVTIALDSLEAFHIPFGNKTYGNLDKRESFAVLAEVIESESIDKIGHNFKCILQLLRHNGLTLHGALFDTMVAAYIIDPGKRQDELSDLLSERLGLDIKAGERAANRGKENTLLDLLTDEIKPHIADAACAVHLLADKLKPVLAENNGLSLYNDIELPLEPVLADLEWHGVLIDTQLLSQMSTKYAAEIEHITHEIYDLAGTEFNLNSPKQLADVLFGKLGLHGGKKTKGGSQSTRVEVLEKLAEDHPVAQKILEYREKQKLLSTYIDALPLQILPETKRVHTTFNQAITATGRLSSTNPNLQNIPIRTESGKKIREAFITPNDYLMVSADYSQIELRILAHLSSDPMLMRAFIDDMDIHTQTASAVYGIFPEMVSAEMRRAAKTINFGLMYGMGPVNLSKQLGVSFSEARTFIESYFNQFPSIRNYMDTAIQNARDSGYSETLLGRKRYLPEINSSSRIIREAAERTAINTPVQGTAADIIKLAMIRVHSKLNQWPEAKMLLQVHDELVFEVPKRQAEEFAKWVAEEMSAAYRLKVPIKVDTGIGRHWGEAH